MKLETRIGTLQFKDGGLGAINDMWFQWVIDIGKPGPDRGLGGKYLIVAPDYDGPLPEGGYFVAHARTNTVLYALRAFIENGNDPKPTVKNIKDNLKIYPYAAGSYGTPIAEALKGEVRLAGEPKLPEMKFIYASGMAFNTIPLDSPAMIMRIPGVGSQYLMAGSDSTGTPFDGAKTYKVTLPKDIPAAAFWSFTVYDNQTWRPSEIERVKLAPVAGRRGDVNNLRVPDRRLHAAPRANAAATDEYCHSVSA